MLRTWMLAALLMALVAVAGCGSGEGDTPAPAPESRADAEAPEVAVFKFLEAVRTGNEKTADAMLTPLARQKTQEMEMVVAPPGSETASFEVGDVEFVAEDGAHVSCTWSDVDESGQTRTDTIIWMVRREYDGWRVAGMATRVFPDQPPLFLNFEDPEDMIRKQELLQEEIARRAQPDDRQASQPEGVGDPARN